MLSESVSDFAAPVSVALNGNEELVLVALREGDKCMLVDCILSAEQAVAFSGDIGDMASVLTG